MRARQAKQTAFSFADPKDGAQEAPEPDVEEPIEPVPSVDTPTGGSHIAFATPARVRTGAGTSATTAPSPREAGAMEEPRPTDVPATIDEPVSEQRGAIEDPSAVDEPRAVDDGGTIAAGVEGESRPDEPGREVGGERAAAIDGVTGGAPPPPPPSPPAPPAPPQDGVPLADAARQRYLNYALSVITSRALPDVRDGLKPVQRRILYAMWKNLRLLPDARFRKSAAVVGDVMARYHPHGDQSIYDAMVRLAQPFALRNPLVEGHGNFGSLDGDPAAAMRYTEARLRGAAVELVSELEFDTVAMRANYDGTTEEPVVLPARIPQLLVNGCTGIAVGMATSIPPHNLREVCAAALMLIDDPSAPTRQLLQAILGPDFPMGGEIVSSADDLREVYETGRGAVRLQATYSVEVASRRSLLVIDSIPWGQNKASIVERIGEAVRALQLPQLLDVRDESTDGIRIVCELKRGASAEKAMAWLFRHTALAVNVPVNMTVLLPTENPLVGAPSQVGLRTLLRQFLDFRLEVLTRRLQFELARLRKRIHVLLGFEILFDALDGAIALIRASDGKKDAASKLMARFPLDDEQTDAILELRLYRLARLEVLTIRQELATLRAEAARIEVLLGDDALLWGEVRRELTEVASLHGDPRRTRLSGRELGFDADDYKIAEDSWVFVTRAGFVKRQKGFSELSAVRVREGDSVGWALCGSTQSSLLFLSDAGRAYSLRVDAAPATAGYGDPLSRHFALQDGERIIEVLPTDARLLPEWELLVERAIGAAKDEDADRAGEGEGDAETEADAEVEAAGEVEGAVEAAVEVDAGTGLARDPEFVGEGVVDAAVESSIASSDVAPPEDVPPTVAIERENFGPVCVVVTKLGRGLLFPLRPHRDPSTRNGRRYCSLGPGDAVHSVLPLRSGEARLCLATSGGHALAFRASDLKALRAAGRGVQAIKLGKGDRVFAATLVEGRDDGLPVQTTRGRDVLIRERDHGGRRGGRGVEIIRRGGLTAASRGAVVIAPRGDDEGLPPAADPADDVADSNDAADSNDVAEPNDVADSNDVAEPNDVADPNDATDSNDVADPSTGAAVDPPAPADGPADFDGDAE